MNDGHYISYTLAPCYKALKIKLTLIDYLRIIDKHVCCYANIANFILIIKYQNTFIIGESPFLVEVMIHVQYMTYWIADLPISTGA